jgi:hypothetical protein
MKNQRTSKNLLAGLSLAAGLICTSAAQAALEDLGNGMISDTDLGIVWLADANFAHTGPYGHTTGLMNWNEANNTWASNLTYNGISEWRLPTIDEMRHLRNDELGGSSNQNLFSSHNQNFNLFSNLNNYWYWTSTEAPNDAAKAALFGLGGGQELLEPKSNGFYAMAVSTIPEPETYAMLLAGLGLVGFIARRRK